MYHIKMIKMNEQLPYSMLFNRMNDSAQYIQKLSCTLNITQ